MTEGIGQEGERLGELFGVPAIVAAAHELKSPLALMRQLALYAEQTDDPVAQGRLLRQITLTSERALRLTTDLTKAARLEDSLFTLEPLNPVPLCEEVVREVTPLFRAKGREVRLSPRIRPLLGVANRELLRRILLNFVDNALHYSQAGEPVVITAVARNGGNAIRLGVRDYGPMIPTDTWRVLRDRLGNSVQPLYGRPESSGLGIYIAQQFADTMEAEVGATRHRDGVTFYVDIRTSTQMRLL
ncbi:MAG: HAMP domain-containing sensor histidine kinase [Candidatus Saccharimonas sp.]